MALYSNFRCVFVLIVVISSMPLGGAKNTIQNLANNEDDQSLADGGKSEEQSLVTDTTKVLNDTEIDSCEEPSFDVELNKRITVKTSNFGNKRTSYDANITCSAFFKSVKMKKSLKQGSRTCIPVINCKAPVKLRKRVKGSCREDYLLVSDGLGGEKDYCGNERLLSTKPSNNGKDLYLKFVTGGANPNPSFSGFKCTVFCESVNKKAYPLQSSKKKKKILSNCVCGIQKKGVRIVGGKTAKQFEFPWLVALVNPFTREPFCGGAIISEKHILSAAHCFSGEAEKVPGQVQVVAHAHQLTSWRSSEYCSEDVPLGQNCSKQGIGWELNPKSDRDENSTRYIVTEIIKHPLYDGTTFDNDVAILKLATKINLKDVTVPICLPKRTSQRNTYKGKKVTVAGWGIGHKLASANNALLQKLEDMPIIDQKRCQKLLSDGPITGHMMCAGFLEGGKDSCQGDSGGPLWYTTASGQNTQLGIVSFGDDECGDKNKPGVYTDLQEMMEWVNYNTWDPDVGWCKETKKPTSG